MLKKPESFAETTAEAGNIDIFSDMLRSLRISGSLLLKEEYVAPWAVSVPGASDLARLLNLGSGARVAAFHLVQREQVELKLGNREEVLVQAGEIAVCFAGAAHRLSQGNGSKALSFEAIKSGAANLFAPNEENKGRSTSLVCGIFLMQETQLNPLFAALPPLLHTDVSRPNGFPALSGVAQLLVQEVNRRTLGGGYMVERLLELLCADAIRSYLQAAPEQKVGWFRGFKDPVVGKAIAIIHAQPGADWSVGALAQRVAISPSRFAARFSAALGESPMAYVTKWRMHVASALLNNTQQSIDQISANVGYESLAAFSRTFKRYLGLPPAAWRAGRRAS